VVVFFERVFSFEIVYGSVFPDHSTNLNYLHLAIVAVFSEAVQILYHVNLRFGVQTFI
jgi:hypothetical protein